MPSQCTTGNKIFKAKKGKRSVEVIAWRKLPASRPTGTTSPLVGIGLADGGYLERIHAHLRVVYLELAVSGVHNVVDTIDCYRGELIERTAMDRARICTCQ